MNDIIRQFANSETWEIVKKELFEKELDRLRDVRTELNNIEPQYAYYAKIVASEALENIIIGIDLLKNTSQANKQVSYE